MTKSKHFVLLAHADDGLAFLRNTVGFELSRCLGLAWTPAQEPVEVVLNGDYIGLYMLTENIRVDDTRVNITEQSDEETDAEKITGGWLVEIDNYDDDPHIDVDGMTITYKSPEVLSTAQENYLTAQMQSISNYAYDDYGSSSTEWETLIDKDDLVRFYIVQEILDNQEAFHGSCYIHKDIGASEKWHFGPVWDFGNAYQRGYDKFIYEDSQFGVELIDGLVLYDSFQASVLDIWADFYANSYASMTTFIDDFADQIEQAVSSDYSRWPQYGASDAGEKASDFKQRMSKKVAWLVGQWGGTASSSSDHVYFINSVGWDQVYCWIWNADDTDENYTGGSWPGEQLTKVGTTDDGDYELYEWTYSGSTLISSNSGIVFSNGNGDQTDDFVYYNGGYYNKEGLQKIESMGVSDIRVASPIEVFGIGGKAVVVAQQSTVVTAYNLAGQRFTFKVEAGRTVLSLPRGLYVIEGRKVLVR